MYIGVNNQAKKVSNAYIGINGQAKQISKIYIGINNQAKLAWENYSPYEELPEDKEFKNLNTSVFYKPETNYIDYIIPETNWYQIELISPFTQGLSSLEQGLKKGEIKYGFGEDLDSVIDLTKKSNYSSENIKASFCPKDANPKQLQIQLTDMEGPGLGRGSSYGSKILKLKKGQVIRFSWIDFGYNNLTNAEEWGKQLKISFLNTSIETLHFYSDQKNNHIFSENITTINRSPKDDNNITLSTEEFMDEEDTDDIIRLKINSTRTKYYSIPITLEGKFETISGSNKIYGIYNTQNSINNSSKCQELGLGASQEENGIGNASIYFNLDFNSTLKSLQFKAGQSMELTGEIFPGCFRITPASIKTEE